MVEGRVKQKRGIEKRESLLDAAITVIARDGLEGFSHRAVAAEAGASLASTTYYFSSKNDLILQAFEQFTSRGAPRTEAVWQAAHHALDGWHAGQVDRTQTIGRLADLALEYVIGAPGMSREGVAFELAFLYQPRLDPELARHIGEYRMRVFKPARDFLTRCGSALPDIDTEIFIGLILRLELENLSRAIETPPERVRAQLVRFFDTIMADQP